MRGRRSWPAAGMSRGRYLSRVPGALSTAGPPARRDPFPNGHRWILDPNARRGRRRGEPACDPAMEVVHRGVEHRGEHPAAEGGATCGPRCIPSTTLTSSPRMRSPPIPDRGAGALPLRCPRLPRPRSSFRHRSTVRPGAAGSSTRVQKWSPWAGHETHWGTAPDTRRFGPAMRRAGGSGRPGYSTVS